MDWGLENFENFYDWAVILVGIMTVAVWGNLFYEIAKDLLNLEETLASGENQGWNLVKTSTLFLGFVVMMQGFTLYMTLNNAAEPLIEDGKIDHWIELYNIEETLEYRDGYDKEEDWYIRQRISRFLESGLLETGVLIMQAGLFFQGLYRGNRKIRLTEKGLYTEEGRKKISKIKYYKLRGQPTEENYKLVLQPEVKKFFFWESDEEPKKRIMEVDRRDRRTLEDFFRLEDVKKEETL